jgi:hypothetical protein
MVNPANRAMNILMPAAMAGELLESLIEAARQEHALSPAAFQVELHRAAPRGSGVAVHSARAVKLWIDSFDPGGRPIYRLPASVALRCFLRILDDNGASAFSLDTPLLYLLP